jgi:hypothetical protein
MVQYLSRRAILRRKLSYLLFRRGIQVLTAVDDDEQVLLGHGSKDIREQRLASALSPTLNENLTNLFHES